MNRTQIHLTDEVKQELDTITERTGRSKSDLIREAVVGFIARHSAEVRRKLLRTARGIWSERDGQPDFTALRGEWYP